MVEMPSAIEMKKTAKEAQVSAVVGGCLALEYANTAAWHLGHQPVERLRDWRALVRWAAEVKLVEPSQMEELLCASVEIKLALDLREAIFRIGLAVTRGSKPEENDLNAVLTLASAPLPSAVWNDGMLSWRFQSESAMAQILGIVARDAVALLARAFFT